MDLSLSVVVFFVSILSLSAYGLLELCLKHFWNDRRTKKYKLARKWAFALYIVSSLLSSVSSFIAKTRAEAQSDRLNKELEAASEERKRRAMTGSLESHVGLPHTFSVGNATFFMPAGRSFLETKGISNFFPKITEQNSVIVDTTKDGKLAVTARICSRDGLVAELICNEWKVSPSPKTWDRNFSSNALEVKSADGEIAFQVELKKEPSDFDSLHFQGRFFDSDGNGVSFTESENGNGAMASFSVKGLAPLPKIKPLFKYPSDIHLGERVDK